MSRRRSPVLFLWSHSPKLMSRYSIAEQIQKTPVMRGLKVWSKVKHVIAVACAGTFSCVFLFLLSFSPVSYFFFCNVISRFTIQMLAGKILHPLNETKLHPSVSLGFIQINKGKETFLQKRFMKLYSFACSCNCSITLEGLALCSCWPHDHQPSVASLTPVGIVESDCKSHQITHAVVLFDFIWFYFFVPFLPLLCFSLRGVLPKPELWLMWGPQIDRVLQQGCGDLR